MEHFTARFNTVIHQDEGTREARIIRELDGWTPFRIRE